MHEQGKAAAWCGRLLLFTAMTVGGAGVAALSVLLGGAPAGRRATARPTAPRTGPPWPIAGAPRPPLLARLSVPRA
ncbi:hypothetical protein AB0952_38810 [Streptomyces caniferus]|uniref:hypothetical protein n=1 Tax=Streptomyces caniferus TaxID=285557 RepID=UPI003454FCF9